MICSRCGTENRAERKFCLRCGNSLQHGCPNCGATNEPDASFCGECGSVLGATSFPLSAPSAASSPAAGPRPEQATGPVAAERRLVSVLFADLVGFTTLTEGLDSEDTRELLGRYFETARDIVGRYGGTLEKFIGDAVMAVWGTPVAHEDDAERAVRAALDLTAAVAAMAGDGPPRIGSVASLGLQARAAVLTGEAAVTIGAAGQGMVAGDLVNTASRLQSVAEPGTVLVGEATWRAASNAVAFEAIGGQALKGKAVPVPAWRALNVVALVGGAGRSAQLEPPFVGRDAEFSALKERLHATTRDGRARLVSIVGVAGIGKSRLAWELEKYIDGLVEPVYWHHGRSPAYGEGLAFWALGEMVRRRAGIAERDDDLTTRQKLDASLAEWIPDDEERRWVGPRLRALLGLEDAPAGPREELFAAWRTFLEGVAARATTVLVFEDLHWADPGLIDFIESLLEWSRSKAILIVTLARPELLERRPTWGAGVRDFTALRLDPLPAPVMTELVQGIAGGLSADVIARIVGRAEGIPLYAVELFRMLVDRGQLGTRADGQREMAGLDELEVPETLHALISARLDALAPAERRLAQDASVLGKTFAIEAIAAVVGVDPPALEPALRGLVRSELLTIDADPRSPERGQYGFVGALVREVAYGTLARRDRRERHLAAARYFETLGDDELAGILASHYTDAYAASREGPEAEAVAAQARLALRAAAERSLALASPAQAVTYLRRAQEVTTDRADLARLYEEIGRYEQIAGNWTAARTAAETAMERFTALGDPIGVAQASATLGQVLLADSRIEAAIDALQAALSGIADTGQGRLEVVLRGELARAEMFSSRPAEALVWVEAALIGAANLDLVEAIADLLVTRSWAIAVLGRARESIAGLHGAIALAEENGLSRVRFRAINNLANYTIATQPRATLDLVLGAMAEAERLGDRDWLEKLAFASIGAFFVGDWALATSIVDRHIREDQPVLTWAALAAMRTITAAWSGASDEAHADLVRIRERVGQSASIQDQFAIYFAEAYVAIAEDRPEDAATAARGLLETSVASGDDPLEGAFLGGLMAAWQDDLPGIRASLDVLGAIHAKWELIGALVGTLDGALAARDGRGIQLASALFRPGIDGLRRLGHEFFALLAELEVIGVLDPGDPLAAAGLEHLRQFASVRSSPPLATLIERRIGDRERRATAVAARTPADAGRAVIQAGAPQNVRTTS